MLLELAGVTKSFGGLMALCDLDLCVEQGEIVSLIGPNGAGKTTVFNLITGLYGPDCGAIRFEGQSLLGLQPHQITARGIARTFQTLRLFTNMTVLENVMVAQHPRGRVGTVGTMLRLPCFGREEAAMRERALAALSLFGPRLSGFRLDQMAYSLSYANRRRLEIARARLGAKAPLAGRAHRRDEPPRDAGAHRHDRPTARPGLYHPVHRARHARRAGRVRSGGCAGLWPQDRRGRL